MKKIEDIVQAAKDNRASDVHIACGMPAMFRIDGRLQKLDDDVLAFEDCEAIGQRLGGEKFSQIRDGGELDLSETIGTSRCRINLYRTKGTCSVALRVLADQIPDLASLGLPKAVNDFSSYGKGIVLVTGETGSGKSTTLAAILNEINKTKQDHIITLEDPIEYIYEPIQSVISQREIGKDTQNYATGLRAILREDPNVILVGEMRDPETIETALTAAETGHLVFATLHTNSAVDSVDRIVGTFPAEKQAQVRMQLASTLKAVLSQQLLVKKGGKGRVAACECMIVTPAIKNQITEGNTSQMQSSMLASANLGSITMDNCLIDLANRGVIDVALAVEKATNQDYVKQSLGFRKSNGFDVRRMANANI